MSKLEIKPATPTIGANVSGVDLRAPTSEQVQEIQDALLTYGVLFFRNQELTPEQHLDFGRHFGRLHVHPYLPSEEKYPEIYRLEATEATESQEKHYTAQWHADVTCDAEPPMGAILMIRDIPANSGGDTLWCNTYAAYDALSDEMKRFLSRLTATHGKALFYETEETGGRPGQQSQTSEHPVIRTHPVTGRPALYVNSIFTKRIVQLQPIESDYLLQMLFRHIENPRFHCRFKWEPGSVAFWDNRCTQHRGIGDYAGYRRYGQRVTLCGDRPFFSATGLAPKAAE
jgi:taurine dioxygenase